MRCLCRFAIIAVALSFVALAAFMDEFNVAGLVPISLVRWELTGQMSDDVKRMLGR